MTVIMLRRAVVAAVAECSHAQRSRTVAVLHPVLRAPSLPAGIYLRNGTALNTSLGKSFSTSSAKGKEREANGHDKDLLIETLTLMMRKRDALVDSQANTSVINHVKAKEISDLDDLFKLHQEWQSMNKFRDTC
jgi:hypothetical protein